MGVCVLYDLKSLTAAIAALALAAVSMTFLPTQATAKRASASSSSSCLPGVLKRRLSQLRSKFGAIRVISTFRRGARIAGTGRPSFHASCRAVDFLPPRGKYSAVANRLKQNHFGGVGTYSCGMYHIHMDNGPRVRFHKCGRRGTGRYAKRKRSRSRKAIYRNRKRRSASRRTIRRSFTKRARAKISRKSPIVKRQRRSLAQRFANNRENQGSQ